MCIKLCAKCYKTFRSPKKSTFEGFTKIKSAWTLIGQNTLSNKNVFPKKTQKNYLYPILNDKHLFQISSKLFTKKFKNAEITNENNLLKTETCQICNQICPEKEQKSLLLPFDGLPSHKISGKRS